MEEYFSLADDNDCESLNTFMQGRDNNDKNNIDQIHSMMSFGNPVNI